MSGIVWSDGACTAVPSKREVRLTRASDIKPRPVRWLWGGRLACGTFVLLGGREGIGKSLVECEMTARLTRGQLPGVYLGQPRAVIIAATEDSWEHTLVPRLMAAGADLALVYRVDVVESDGCDGSLSLPRDLPAVEEQIIATEAAMLWCDPLMSRIDATLDTHKDSEVRRALEPLAKMAERTGCVACGLIHVNKSASQDPLTTLMASRAFAAVARGVMFVMVDPQDEHTRLFGIPKNNLGRSDWPPQTFKVENAFVMSTDEGDIWTGRLVWTGESQVSIREAMQQASETAALNKTVVGEAADWLADYLTSKGGSADSADVKKDGAKAGHTKDALHRARAKLQVASVSVGFPRRTHWMLSSRQSSDAPGENPTTTTTAITATTEAQLSQSSESSESLESPRASATTGGTNGVF